jgi:hypothetical protein
MKIPFLPFCMLLAGLVRPAAADVRPFPKRPLLLRSDNLSITLDGSDGLPYDYQYRHNRIWGEDAGKRITAIVCRMTPRAYQTVEIAASSAAVHGPQADFLFETNFEGSPAASFHIKYTLEGDGVSVTLEDVAERSGFELIEVNLPDLATVREEDAPSWLAQGRGGGSVVNLSDAKPGRVKDDRFFGRISTFLPVAIVGTAKVECVMEITAFTDGTETEIVGAKEHRHALIGTVQTFRVHGGRSYDMNDDGPRISGNENTPNLLVGQTPRCRLDFTGDADGDGTVDWLDGAKIVRARMPPIPTHYLDDKFTYLIHGKYKPEAHPRTTFGQSEKLVHDVAMLTDYAPQVAFLGGWVYDGQDTGYPCEDKVNESLGGYEGLKRLMQQGPKYNANITVDVNYDDAYKSCPQFSSDIIARRPDGQLWKSVAWAGETSYITGLAKYMQSAGPNRVKYTIERYGIHDAILVDALSWYAIRNDWDPQHPASGYKNLVEGRFKVIDEFLKYGVHVVSEMLRYPYVGKLTESADGPAGREDTLGGEPIPMIAVVYRKSAIWGGAGSDHRNAAMNLFWNARPINWYSDSTERSEITDFFYLSVLPWTKVQCRDVQSFSRAGYRSKIGLGAGSEIAIDWFNQDYSVTVDNAKIAENNATFCPLDNNRVAFYSRVSQHLSAPLPSGWDAAAITARALYADRREELPVQVEKGKIDVAAPAGRPIIVYRNAEAANKHAVPDRN